MVAMNKKENIKDIIVSCVLGGSLEWYSFAIYGFLSTIMGANFFPSGDTFQQSIASLGAFAVGLLSRPIGALLFGYISSAIDQKTSFSISVYLMAIATFLIGLLPTYETIGTASTVILLFLRVLQGLSLGGGFTGTMVFLYEHSPDNKKNTYTVWASFCLIFGFILCTVASTLLSSFFSQENISSYAWRIPFLVSIFGIVAANYINRKLEAAKNGVNENKAKSRGLLRELFIDNWKTFFTVLLIDALTGCGFFIIAIFFTTYFSNVMHMDSQTVSISQMLAMSLFAVVVMLSGRLADIIGGRRLMIAASIALAFTAYPIFLLSKTYGTTGAIACQILVIIIFSIYHGALPAAICKSFSKRIRPIGVAASHNLAMAIFGAYSPSLAAKLIKNTGDIASPGYLVAGTAIITILGLYFYIEKRDN